MPESKRKEFGPPLVEGFNSLTFKLDLIKDALESHYFKSKYLTAVGKTEWADIKWSEQSIADKKNLINDAHLVFIAADSPEAYRRAQESLASSRVNARLLDCSDAHEFSDSSIKDRLGNCFTWIKADPTFEGLRQAVIEFPQRVFVGERPKKLKRVDKHPTKYLRSLEIRKLPGSPLDEQWFDCNLPLNVDLVAVIGNKGSGKSALLDVLGLLGHTRNEESFSFLNKEKFRQPRENKAKHFVAVSVWESGLTISKNLDAPIDAQEVELVKYIPQNFLERICNEMAGADTAFDRELKKVIFSHVGHADRLGHDSLDDLIAFKTKETYRGIDLLKAELRVVNESIVDLEGQNTTEYRSMIGNLLKAKQRELDAHDRGKPTEVAKPEVSEEARKATEEVSAELERAKRRLDHTVAEIAQAIQIQSEQARRIAILDSARAKLENFRKQLESARTELAADLQDVGVDVDRVFTVQIDVGPLDAERTAAQARKRAADALLDSREPSNLLAARASEERAVEGLRMKLDEPNQRYQTYLSALEAWEAERKVIVGGRNVSGTVMYYEGVLEELQTVPDRLNMLYNERRQAARSIYAQISRLADAYRTLYEPVQRFIDDHGLAREKLELRFEVSIVEEGFAGYFMDLINQRVIGSFSGIEEGYRMLTSMVERYDFNDESQVIAFVDDVMNHLTQDRRAPGGVVLNPADQLRTGRTLQALYEAIFALGYLRPRYVLRLGGKELHELSPGERGSLLLIFYLLVDKDDVPLVIDQPEENLDNQTVYELLVPCVREAKQRRQIVIITHNPNIAVVCDAEQVVYSAINKAAKNTVSYVSGSIENPEINKRILDVLEGTRPAFDRRDAKYLA